MTGFQRPDVKSAFFDAPDDNTGFEIRGTLPAGTVPFHLEAQFADGRWDEIITETATVKRQWLPLWLGGGNWTDLMFFQMPTNMAYRAKALKTERFPTGKGIRRPKITIVTPSFNQCQFLAETMESVLTQTGIDCRYIVRDGGSTDGSANYIQRHSNRLHAWVSEKDGGQADAIAKGFANAEGSPDDIMAWINSDDFYLLGALQYVADYFSQHPEVDAIYGHRIVVDEASQEIARWFLPKHDPEVLRLNDFVPQETLFWRKRIWDKVGGLDTSFQFAMDWDLLLRFQAAGANIVRVPYFLACFRVHSAQKTSARMHDIGQKEITFLRERTHGRIFPVAELETNSVLISYLRKSSWIEFLWRKLGIRAR